MNPNHLPSQAWITLKMSRPTEKSLIQAGLGKPPKCLFGPISAQLLGRGWIPGQGCAAIQEAPQPRTCWARLAPSFLLNLPGADPRTRHFSQAASSAAWKHFQPFLPGQACPTSAGFTLTFLSSSGLGGFSLLQISLEFLMLQMLLFILLLPTQPRSCISHPKPQLGPGATPEITSFFDTMKAPAPNPSFPAAQQRHSQGISTPWGRFPLLVCGTGQRGLEMFALTLR